MNILSKLKDKTLPVEVKASTAYTLCSILQRSLSFITLPLFTRLLTTEEYGQSTVYNSWMSILVIFLTLNLPYGSFNTAMMKFEKNRDGYISSVNGLCTVFAVAFLLIVYFPFHKAWNKVFELPTIMMVFMVVESLFNNATQLWMGKQRFEFRYKKVIAVTLLTSIASPVLSFILVMNTQEKGYARILGNSIIIIGCGSILYLRCLHSGKKLCNKEYWKYALLFNVPLIPYYLSQTIFNQSDRIMISHMVGTDKAAIYGVGYSLALVLSFVLNSINNAYVPWFYGKLKEGKGAENRKISLYIALLMAVLLLGVITAAPEIILIMAGRKYQEAMWVVPPVAMSLLLLFYAQLFINVEFYFEEKKLLVIATGGAAVLNIILNYFCIKEFGFVAAAYTTLVSYILFAVCNYFAYLKAARHNSIKTNMYNIKLLIVLFVSFMALGFAAMGLYKFIVIRYVIIIAALVVFIINGKKIIGFVRSFRY